ncbi:chemotaxis protein [Streptococcus dysgalactiae]|uniref:Methyl-accepting chemotaxis protein n=1 Tax=Streptococcus dysgalactiae TaxID=1334 RepID=A0A9X9SI74_STRDY|nr:chemotaxis protein [Streptococcus dysgalactiae]VTS79367.1 methyl-accepting chemotaxis protein [Streptococcus dysgalactiae]
MKTKTFLALGLLAFAAYKGYQKRDLIKETVTAGLDAKEAIQFDLDKIKGDSALIQDQSRHIQDLGQDLTYKWRVFNQETQAHLSEIQTRLAKYQDKTNTNSDIPSQSDI